MDGNSSCSFKTLASVFFASSMGLKSIQGGTFPGGPVVKNLPCNAGDMGSIICQGTKIPHALEQPNLCAATKEPEGHN